MSDPAHRRTVIDQGFVTDAAGLPVDCRISLWILNNFSREICLDWSKFPVVSDGVLRATAVYIAGLIQSQSPVSVNNAFKSIVLVMKSSEFCRADANDTLLPFAIFRELQKCLKHQSWRLHYIRQWYEWCANFGFPNFSLDVAFQANQLTIGGNQKGQAVLSADPEEGPLSDSELAALLTAMRAAKATNAIPMDQLAGLWLCIALGPNPVQMALLAEEDLIYHRDSEALAFAHLRVPRMKKGEPEVRAAFRSRSITHEIASILSELIESDRNLIYDEGPVENHSRPIFKRWAPRPDLIDGPLDRYSWHLSSAEFNVLIRRGVAALGVISPVTGRPLRVSTRRLRYTFATRLVREGASKHEVADLLDHSDLQNVQVYFDIKSDIVEPLDRATAMALAPIGQAFMGALIYGPDQAKRGDDPDSSIAVIGGSPSKLRQLGNCGSLGFCGFLAPIACYTCSAFQAWIDAPHHLVLDGLLNDRERRFAAGLDGRIVTMLDSTICAVAQVIERIGVIAAESK